MKFAICNETFQDWPFEKAFTFAAECGYTGVEIAPFTMANDARDISAAQRNEVRRQAEVAGLEVVGIHWLLAKTEGFYMTSPEKAVRQKTAAYFRELAGLCADLGGRIMVCGSPQQRNLLPGVSHEQAMEYAREVFAEVVPALEEQDVVLAFEPLAPSDTNFIQTAASGVELIESIGSPHFRLHLDCKAMASESVPIADLIRQHHRLLAHFHANDPNLRGPGFGDLAFGPIFEALGEVDYRGWVSVEVFDYTPGVERLVRESIEYMHGCLD
ncbi:MAG: sugar phosphate isomerase/epimerase family protein [Patescibacteria group bacterium]|nr:sugar phosphate isomerase/epimerase family protein [Patescibacteria group bacterium]